METRSIFSVNTNQTGFKNPNNNFANPTAEINQIHQFFYRILPTFSKECPYLAKIFYLQLVLRENVLIYTEDRVDARDIWLTLSRMLDLKKPEIYVVDQKINFQQLLATKNEYQRILLYDVNQMSTQMINKLLNSQSQISLLGVQDPKKIVSSHISDFFSMMVLYQQQHKISHLVDNLNNQLQSQNARNFDKRLFNQCVKLNFQIVMQHAQQQGFLKPFLQIFQKIIQVQKIKVSQSKWKKMLRILKFIGVNKQEGTFKKMSLGDLLMSPQLLASSVNELHIINQALFKALKQFVPYYGNQKFQKSLKNHFWLSPSHLLMAEKILSELKSSISFFYPCIKFPETALIRFNQENLSINYQIRGYEKKLMSDHHYQIQIDSKYCLSMEIKSDNKMTVHFGIACYDKLKNVILPVQACRKENSQVMFQRLQGDHLTVKNLSNLSRWQQQKDNFAYQRAIGVYINGQTHQIPQLSQILYNNKEPYSKTNRPYQAIKTLEQQKDLGEMIISQDTREWFVNFKHLLQKNKTVLMNHYEGGVGCIGQSLVLEGHKQWKKVQIQYHGTAFANLGTNFFPTTKYLRIVVMVNYNSGYPEFQIPNKNAIFEFRNISFELCQ